MPSVPSVPVSWGELLDKVSILEIKRERLPEGPGLLNVEREHALLGATAREVLPREGIAPLFEQLQRINRTLWDVEDALRQREEQARFGPGFVALARSVYQTNDSRAAIKRQINLLLESELVEEKSYAATSPAPRPQTIISERIG